jgi:hypothetical protein
MMGSSIIQEPSRSYHPHTTEISSNIERKDKFFEEIENIEPNIVHKPYEIRDLHNLYCHKNLNLDTEYQRTEVWSIKKKRRLIDSILRKYDISTIYLRQRINGAQIHFECVDGKQRLKSISDFIDNKFAITPDVTSKLEHAYCFSQLPDRQQWDIRTFKVYAVVISGVDDNTIADIFMRLQEGERLNDAERLNALTSKMREAVIEISRHSFLPATSLKNHRFAYNLYAAQMLTLSASPESSDVRYSTLKRTYELYRNGIPRKVLEKTKRSLTQLENLLASRSSIIRSKSDILILHLIVSNLLLGYSIIGFEERIANFIIKFITKVSRVSRLANEQSKDPHIQYAYYKKFAYLYIQKKYEIMATELLQSIPEIRPKDRNRVFNDIERLAICVRANFKCEFCPNITGLNEGHADHIIRHTDGGLTVISNGRWLCKGCHKERHSRSRMTIGELR